MHKQYVHVSSVPYFHSGLRCRRVSCLFQCWWMKSLSVTPGTDTPVLGPRTRRVRVVPSDVPGLSTYWITGSVPTHLLSHRGRLTDSRDRDLLSWCLTFGPERSQGHWRRKTYFGSNSSFYRGPPSSVTGSLCRSLSDPSDVGTRREPGLFSDR